MTLRPRLPVLIAVLVAGGALGAVPVVSAKRAGCPGFGPPAASSAWVAAQPGYGGTYEVCDKARGRRFFIGNSYERVTDVRVRGRFLAYSAGIETSTDSGVNTRVKVIDVSRRVRHRFEAYSGQDTHAENRGVEALEVTSRGALSWIAQRDDDLTFEVRYAVFGRKARTLDRAANIIPSSLAVGRKFIYWQRTDGARAAAR